jgi:hypothetical protein
VCFEIIQGKKNDLSKSSVSLGASWNHFRKTIPTYPKMVFGYGGLFVTLKGMQLVINKPTYLP